GMPARVQSSTIHIPVDMRESTRRRLVDLWASQSSGRVGFDKQRFAIVHPGSGGREKCWPPASFAEVTKRIIAAGWCAVGILGPVELETWKTAELREFKALAPHLVNLDLLELPAVLAVADLYVGNDSGVTHVAAATGTRTIAIFGPTDPRVWQPLGDHVRVIAPSHVGDGWPSVDMVLAMCT